MLAASTARRLQPARARRTTTHWLREATLSEVRATDLANNTDPTPASYTWTVNTVPSGTGFCSILGNDPKPSLLDQDIYKLRGTKGEQVRIRLEAIGNNNTGDKASLTLVGIGLLKTDNSALPNEVSAVLPTTGEYLVIVAELPLILSSSQIQRKLLRLGSIFRQCGADVSTKGVGGVIVRSIQGNAGLSSD